MVRCVAYGSEKDSKFYVQTCCGEEHYGEECDCKSLGDNLTEEDAKRIAEEKSKELNVPLEFWDKSEFKRKC